MAEVVAVVVEGEEEEVVEEEEVEEEVVGEAQEGVEAHLEAHLVGRLVVLHRVRQELLLEAQVVVREVVALAVPLAPRGIPERQGSLHALLVSASVYTKYLAVLPVYLDQPTGAAHITEVELRHHIVRGRGHPRGS